MSYLYFLLIVQVVEGTPYPSTVKDFSAMLEKPPLAAVKPHLAVDETGVGAPVVDLFREAKLNVRL